MTTFRYFSGILIWVMIICSSCGELKENSTGGDDSSPGNISVQFFRTNEPNEHAFSFLLPQNWTVSGGISRVDPNAAGGPGNAIEAKLYMKLSSPASTFV